MIVKATLDRSGQTAKSASRNSCSAAIAAAACCALFVGGAAHAVDGCVLLLCLAAPNWPLLSSWDTRFDDDYAAWRSAQAAPCGNC